MSLKRVDPDQAKDIDESVVWISFLGAAVLGLSGAALGALGVPNVNLGPINLLALPMVVWTGHAVGWYLGELLTGRCAAQQTTLRPPDVFLHGLIGWIAAFAILIVP